MPPRSEKAPGPRPRCLPDHARRRHRHGFRANPSARHRAAGQGPRRRRKRRLRRAHLPCCEPSRAGRYPPPPDAHTTGSPLPARGLSPDNDGPWLLSRCGLSFADGCRQRKFHSVNIQWRVEIQMIGKNFSKKALLLPYSILVPIASLIVWGTLILIQALILFDSLHHSSQGAEYIRVQGGSWTAVVSQSHAFWWSFQMTTSLRAPLVNGINLPGFILNSLASLLLFGS